MINTNDILSQYSVGRINLSSSLSSCKIKSLDTYFIFWIEKGSVSITINGVKNIVYENYFVFCNVNTIISFQSENNSKIRYFKFLSPKFSDFYSIPFIDLFPIFFKNDELYKEVFLIDEYKSLVLFYYKLLISIQESKKTNLNLLYVNNIIEHIILLVFSLFDDNSFLFDKSRESQKLLKFKELVEKFIFKERSVSFYCNAIGLQYSTLNKFCMSEFGTNVKSYLDARCIAHIKCKLSTSSLTISEVSDFFHFSDISNFNRFFKRLTKQTVSEYRNMISM